METAAQLDLFPDFRSDRPAEYMYLPKYKQAWLVKPGLLSVIDSWLISHHHDFLTETIALGSDLLVTPDKDMLLLAGYVITTAWTPIPNGAPVFEQTSGKAKPDVFYF